MIIRDALNIIVTSAALSGRRSICKATNAQGTRTVDKTTWSLRDSAGNAISHATYDAVRDYGLSLGYDMPDSMPPAPTYGSYNVTVRHPEGESTLAAHEAEWQDARPIYVRYGKPPKGGKSCNHADGRDEAGVSVFRGQMLPDGRWRTLIGDNPGSVMALGRDAYQVAGREIGTGSDGEPVLADCKIIRKLQ